MLKKTLKNIVPFDSNTLNVLANLFSELELSKGKVFAKKGEYSKNMAFVKSGVLRPYYSNDNGKEYNKTFLTENSFLGAYSSLITWEKELLTNSLKLLQPRVVLDGELSLDSAISSSDWMSSYEEYGRNR